jgi:hypothetical protein
LKLIRKVLSSPVQSEGKIIRVEICVNQIRGKQLCKSVHDCAKRAAGVPVIVRQRRDLCAGKNALRLAATTITFDKIRKRCPKTARPGGMKMRTDRNEPLAISYAIGARSCSAAIPAQAAGRAGGVSCENLFIT